MWEISSVRVGLLAGTSYTFINSEICIFQYNICTIVYIMSYAWLSYEKSGCLKCTCFKQQYHNKQYALQPPINCHIILHIPVSL